MDGTSFRKIADQHNCSPATVYTRVTTFLKSLPHNLEVTYNLCDMSSFCGWLIFDGTYISVKGYPKKIPMIWGIDYSTHDLPYFMLVPSESYVACVAYFSHLKNIGYDLKYIVCDDNDAIKQAVVRIYPDVIIQACIKHYLTNVGNDLNIKSSDKYKDFFFQIRSIFNERLLENQLAWRIQDIYDDYKDDEKQLYWMTDIMFRRKELTNYLKIAHVPRTTNLIELYNSHLKGRLKSIKGFEGYHSAKRWLNAYILRRRLKNFTDCSKKFKHLNGTCSLAKTIRNTEELPNLF